jgi:putative Holliday junction resolvase
MPGTPERPAGGEPAVVMAFDYGARRIGVAVGQATTGTASPAGVIPVHGEPDWAAVNRCMHDWSPARLLVGVPYNMDGTETTLTATCRAFAGELARRYGLPVDCVDERLTSAAATAELREARRSGARSRRVRREDIDAHAARLILETWLREPDHRPGSRP